ncbi:HipA family kinase [Halalkalibacter krulwichiae]|uniref:HipA-like kinase domain-containing protein n=1 Tax=Halalkalibacter krulwichiae TaxID=199441 RepID=A0A1X9MAT8_9BACI|nr:HipA family kinase [Halalkalibacter krulwichiae]ARK29710.1 hypothetical protein BkAM31D_07455 [Halalkalibacter krulwichiae]
MIIAKHYKARLDSKKKNVHVITFDDGKDYAVKFSLPNHSKALVNEWLGYCLARYLQLPVLPSQIIEISKDFYQTIPELQPIPYSKHHFASLYKAHYVNASSVLAIDSICNKEQLPGIITFDYWISNLDRTRKNILLKEKQKKQKYELYIINHAEAFGSTSWNALDLHSLSTNLIESCTHQMLARFIDNKQLFKEQITTIQSIPSLLIEEILSLMPDEWQLAKEERKELCKALRFRSHNILPKLIETFINHFIDPKTR